MKKVEKEEKPIGKKVEVYTSKRLPNLDLTLHGAYIAVIVPEVSRLYEGSTLMKPDTILKREQEELGELPALIVAVSEDLNTHYLPDGSSVIKVPFYSPGNYAFLSNKVAGGAEGSYRVIDKDNDKEISIVVLHYGLAVGKCGDSERYDKRAIQIREDSERTKPNMGVGMGQFYASGNDEIPTVEKLGSPKPIDEDRKPLKPIVGEA